VICWQRLQQLARSLREIQLLDSGYVAARFAVGMSF
jgi:hypothetical protein